MACLNIGLVLLVAAGLVPGGLLLLRQLAAESASARVELAALGAVEGLRLHSEEVLTGTRLLAERPTLHRLLASDLTDDLNVFLAQFSSTSHLDGCAVWVGDELTAWVPADAPWQTIGFNATMGIYAGTESEQGTPLLTAAVVPLAGGVVGSAACFRWLDAELARKLEDQVGLPVHFVFAKSTPQGPYRGDGGSWRCCRSIETNLPGPWAGVEVELPASVVAAALNPIENSFIAVTFCALLAAILAATIAARHLSRPLTELQAAASSIGAGDLSTPVPILGGVEVGALASTMEAMRSRIQRTTVELHQREAEARALLEGMVEGVYAVDEDRRIEYINPQAAQLLGIEVGHAVGRFCGDVLKAVDRTGLRPCDHSCPIVHARSRGSSRSVEHLELIGGRRTMVITSAPPTGGRQVQLMRDETEIEAARRSRDSVLANVSHELKTPLSAQMASIQLLQDVLDGTVPPQAIELVDSLERSTLRLSRLIDNLLESVRIETGRGLPRFVPVSLPAIVAEAEAMTGPLLRQRKQELWIDLPDLAPIAGDPTQLTQVLVNLLANANKFAPEGSTIRLGASSNAGMTSIWIEDAGPGIPSKERSSVFEYFYRALPGAADGMGLGLWIVKSIVERHGGDVEVTAAPDGGARFVIRIPRRTQH